LSKNWGSEIMARHNWEVSRKDGEWTSHL
jgi:hypothetical protein